jgi:hypothetical protein
MKLFTIIKTGYSAGVYGCSNEYFTAIIINDEKTASFMFRGLYGEEHRIADIIKEYGYKDFYVNGAYGKIPSREYKASLFLDEKEIKDLLNNLE